MEDIILFKVSKEIHFCYGHRLMDYQGMCQHPHGHNGKIEIELQGEKLDSRDILVDFGEIRERVKTWIDEKLDHRMLLRTDDPLVKILQEMGEPVFIMNDNPTAESIAKLIFEFCVSQKLPVYEVRLWETPSSFASYRL